MQYLAPLVTFFIGVVATYIARQQWLIARRKLQLDLFDRRYKVYDTVQKFVMAMMQDGKRSIEEKLFELNSGTCDAIFLFGPEVVAYIDEVRRHGIGLHTADSLWHPLPLGDEARSRHINTAHEHRLWLCEQFPKITAVFEPYLSFSSFR